MTITFLSIAIIITAFFQPNKKRFITAALFVVPLALCELATPFVTGAKYYFFVSLVAMFIVFLLKFIIEPPKLALRLQKICIIAVVLNLFGWTLYRLGIQPALYEYLFMALYILTLKYLISWGPKIVGCNRVGRRSPIVYSDVGPVYLGPLKNEGSL